MSAAQSGNAIDGDLDPTRRAHGLVEYDSTAAGSGFQFDSTATPNLVSYDSTAEGSGFVVDSTDSNASEGPRPQYDSTGVRSFAGHDATDSQRTSIDGPRPGTHTHDGGAAAATAATHTHKPTMGDKVLGTVESIVGKVIKNKHMVEEGKERKTGGV